MKAELMMFAALYLAGFLFVVCAWRRPGRLGMVRDAIMGTSIVSLAVIAGWFFAAAVGLVGR